MHKLVLLVLDQSRYLQISKCSKPFCFILIQNQWKNFPSQSDKEHFIIKHNRIDYTFKVLEGRGNISINLTDSICKICSYVFQVYCNIQICNAKHNVYI